MRRAIQGVIKVANAVVPKMAIVRKKCARHTLRHGHLASVTNCGREKPGKSANFFPDPPKMPPRIWLQSATCRGTSSAGRGTACEPRGTMRRTVDSRSNVDPRKAHRSGGELPLIGTCLRESGCKTLVVQVKKDRLVEVALSANRPAPRGGQSLQDQTLTVNDGR